MDDAVIAAMARWPDVPAVHGWLRLDRRGQWLLIDRGQPGFDEAVHGQGSPITSPPIVDFIGRNYQPDDEGRWFWQNGPQRVYVDIDLAPLVLRLIGEGDATRLVTHTGHDVTRIDGVHASPAGDLLLVTDRGPAVLHDLDLAQVDIDFDADDQPASIRVGRERYPVVAAADTPALHFVARPRA